MAIITLIHMSQRPIAPVQTAVAAQLVGVEAIMCTQIGSGSLGNHLGTRAQRAK